jgi:ADP-ribosylglycohydrolase
LAWEQIEKARSQVAGWNDLGSEKMNKTEEAERTYAGVIGKIIGVYFGRPVEGWKYEALRREFGQIEYYPNDLTGMPLIVPDDDISGTFVFVRAILDSWGKEPFCAQTVANTWLNYLVENETVLWWGGLSRSTEHTAYLRLKRGITAPESGSIALNGRAMAEQVGAQIFIDGWGMTNPCDPKRAVALARAAASVSHDGLATDAACLIAAIEALAYEEVELEHLFEAGLAAVNSPRLARLVEEVVTRCATTDDWRSVRDWIEREHGYDKYPGNSPVATNHAAIIMSLIMAGRSFQKSLAICTSAGWDTDSNAGNVGCINGIRLGLAGIDAEADLRGVVADRMFVVSADGGECVTDAVRETRKLSASVALMRGEQLASRAARFEFEFPGATQGFRSYQIAGAGQAATRLGSRGTGLSVDYRALAPGAPAVIAVETFVEPAPPNTEGTSYFKVVGSPSLYPSQVVKAVLEVVAGGYPAVSFFVEAYSDNGVTRRIRGSEMVLARGENELSWLVPDTGGSPIYRLGVELTSKVRLDGQTLIRSIDWDGAPLHFRLGRAEEMSPDLTPWTTDTVWLRSFVSSATNLAPDYTTTFSLSHTGDNGVATIGTSDWSDYAVESRITFNQQKAAGLVARARGHRRYYAGLLAHDRAVIVKRRDGVESLLAQLPMQLQSGEAHTMRFAVIGDALRLEVDGDRELLGRDGEFIRGGAGFVVDGFSIQRAR